MMQQLYQAIDYRLEKLDAIQAEVRRLKRVRDEDQRRVLTEAALDALAATKAASTAMVDRS
jgi:hypothetical protein